MHTEPSRADLLGDIAVAFGCSAWVSLLVVTGLGAVDKAPGYLLTAALFVLPHLYMAALGAIFVAWTLWPDRRALPALATGVGLTAVVLWGPSLAAWPEPLERPVRVASWNVQRLWGLDEDKEAARACVVDALQEIEAEVFVLLEVSAEDVAVLRGDLGLECVHTPYNAGGTAQQGGLAVCVSQGLELRGGRQRFVDVEDWHYLFTEVARGDQTFNVLGVHLYPYKLGAGRSFTRRVAKAQANQSQALLNRVERFRDPTVVAGDFNSTRDFHLHARLRDFLQDTWEVGGLGFGATKFVRERIPLRIDFVYASPSFAVGESSVPAVDCSDHRPVVTELALPTR